MNISNLITRQQARTTLRLHLIALAQKFERRMNKMHTNHAYQRAKFAHDLNTHLLLVRMIREIDDDTISQDELYSTYLTLVWDLGLRLNCTQKQNPFGYVPLRYDARRKEMQ